MSIKLKYEFGAFNKFSNFKELERFGTSNRFIHSRGGAVLFILTVVFNSESLTDGNRKKYIQD